MNDEERVPESSGTIEQPSLQRHVHKCVSITMVFLFQKYMQCPIQIRIWEKDQLIVQTG